MEECLAFERDISIRMMREGDFYEGVRAIIVDKDGNPKYNPRDIYNVTEHQVDELFQSIVK
jgi:hypothetical protein